MNRFSETLLTLSERLDLPQPVKSRILLEIAVDLEDLFRYYRDQGLDESAARRQAIEKTDLSDGALAALIGVHRSWYRRVMDRLTEQAQTRWERAVLVLLALFIAVTAGGLVVTTPLLREAGWPVWPMVAAVAVALGISAARGYALYLKKDHRIRTLRDGLAAILMLGAIIPVWGGFGFCLSFYRSLNRMITDYERAGVHFTEWLVQGASIMIASMLAAILVGLVWFALANRVQGIERAEASVLWEGDRAG